MRGLIIAKNKDSYAVRRVTEELRDLKIPFEVFLWSSLRFTDSDIFHIETGTSLSKFDFIIPRRTQSSLLTILAKFCTEKNVSMINRDFFTRFSSFNKLDQQFYLKKMNLPGIPSTYSMDGTFEETVHLYGLPFIAKLAEGSLGKEVFKVTSKRQFQKFLRERNADGKLFLFQKFYTIGSDYRIFFLHGQVISVVERFNNKSEWRTNVATSEPRLIVKDKDLTALGKRVGKAFGLDLVGLDVLQDENGEWRIIELNTLAQFALLERLSSENVAKKTIEGLLRKIEKQKK